MSSFATLLLSLLYLFLALVTDLFPLYPTLGDLFISVICRNTHEKLSTIIETFRLYTAWIQHKFDSVTPKQWDFGMLLMATWGSYFLNIRQNYENYEVKFARLNRFIRISYCVHFGLE